MATNESKEIVGETTFWELLSRYSIKIPIIQRDYAQGREGEERIAKKFVDALFRALTHKNKLSLDFVYGKIVYEKTENGTLIPIDGQQRLTTLFLLHWYLALKNNSLNESEVKNTLSKFTYETRITSIDFCKKLIEEGINYEYHRKKISDAIRNSKWYFLSWNNDPTVSGMLNMLDIIDDKFKEKNENFFKLLKENSPIVFYFLPLEKFSLTDEVYIKMNARGKPLTEFEKFKAEFSELLSKEEDKAKLDNEWLDIFWKLVKKQNNNNIDIKEVDSKYFNFFENLFLLLYVENYDINRDFIEKYSLLEFLDNEKIKPENERKILNRSNIELILKCLDSLVDYPDDDKIFENFLKSHRERKINYWERVRFYSLFQYFIHKDELTDQNDGYQKWKRVTLNLINNTLIQTPDDFYKSVRSIKELSSYISDLYGYLAYKDIDIAFFYKDQVNEEKEKAKLILEDKEWERLILLVEKHPYFKGQIGFILEMAKNKNGNYDKEQFKGYSDKLMKIFTDFKNRNDFLFERALLAKGDYLVKIGSNYTFCNYEEGLRAKMDNWRKVFNDVEKRKYLKELLDEIKDINKIEETFNKIIKNYDTQDWKKYFIKNPKHLEYCEYRQIRYYDEVSPYPQIYLLSKTQMNGYHAELYTYELYLRCKEDNRDIKIKYEKSFSLNEPYLIVKKNDCSLKIKTTKVSNSLKYVVTMNCKDSNSQNNLMKKIGKKNYDINEIDSLAKIIKQILTIQ